MSGPFAIEPLPTTRDAFDEAPGMLRTGDATGMAALLQLAAGTNPAFGRAARALLGRVGRRALNDAAALAEMARLLAAGDMKSIPVAARYVAAKLPELQSLDAGARRLERKYRKRLAQNIKCRDNRTKQA